MSCAGELVFVDRAAEQVVPLDLMRAWRRDRSGGWRGAGVGRTQVECSMRSNGVVVPDVNAEDVGDMVVTDDQQPVQVLAANASDPALHVSVGIRRMDGSGDDFDALAFEKGVEGSRELVPQTEWCHARSTRGARS